MPVTRVNYQNLPVVFSRILIFLDEDEVSRDEFCKTFDRMLDDLRFDDFFGTEAQRDPRGDGRDE